MSNLSEPGKSTSKLSAGKNSNSPTELTESLCKNASINLVNNNNNKDEENKPKEAAATTSSHGGNNQAVDDEDIEPIYLENWLKALKAYKKAAGANLYPHKFEVTMPLPEFADKFAMLNDGAHAVDVSVSLAGKIMSKSVISKSMFFYYLHGSNAKVLLMANARTSELDEVEFSKFHASLKRGDIIGVTGFPGESEKGELGIFPKSIVILSRCLLMMPRWEAGPTSEYANNGEIWIPGNSRDPEDYVLRDQELRYRPSYLDLMLNAEVRQIFIQSKVISYMKKFLDNLHFSEVETPMMNMIAGGAAARPLGTHHNVLNINRVYEIRKQFRNKGTDLTHSPEFTTCGFYRAHADYEDLMQLTEEMLSGMVKELTGGYIVKYHANGLDKGPIDINFTPPFRRLDMIEELEKMANLKLPKDLSSDETTKYLIDACAKYDVKCPPPQTTARLLDKLVGHFLEDTCVNPTFIINHPEIMSPFAKSHRSKPGLTQRFELFVFKLQLCNAYTELNDPTEVQREQFKMVKHAACGLGFDHLTMLLTGSQNIKEVLL